MRMKTFEALSLKNRKLVTAWLFILTVALRLTDAALPTLLWLCYGLLAGAAFINLKLYFNHKTLARH